MGMQEQEWDNLWSSYINSVPGWLNSWEGRRLMDLAEAMTVVGPVVEIGMYWGRTTLCLAQGVRRAGQGHIWTIDLFEESYTPKKAPLSKSLQTLAKYNVKDLVTIIEGDSRDTSTANQVPNGIALIFIDSEHSFETISKEWEVWSPKLMEGSFVVCHDYGNGDPSVGDGVTRFCDEILREKLIEVEICDRFKNVPNATPGGLFIGKFLKS